MRARVAVVMTALALAGCSGPDDAPAIGTVEQGLSGGELTVFAAASLTDSFGTIGEGFEREHPGVEVSFSFAGSSALAAQITSGAPADVFAAASPETMETVTDAGDALGGPVVFARNRLQIAVPPGNQAGVTDLADFADAGLTIALCAPEVPCGAASTSVLEAAGVEASPDTLEQDVRAVLSKVRLGEVDAALVYRTDVLAAGDAVQGIEVDLSAGAVNEYPVAVLEQGRRPDLARAFVQYVLSAEGQRVLDDAGFDAP